MKVTSIGLALKPI